MGAKRIEFKNDVDPGSFAGFEACVEAVAACTDDDNLIIKSQTCFPRPRFEKAILKYVSRRELSRISSLPRPGPRKIMNMA